MVLSDAARELIRLIDSCLIAIQEDPGHTIFDWKPEHERGLNAVAINAAAESIGLRAVFVLHDDGARRRSIEIRHPVGGPAVVWVVSDPVLPTRAWSDGKIARTVATLRAWREAATARSATRGKPGRKPAPKLDIATDTKLARDWEAARSQSTCKVDFARARGMSTKQLNAVLGRVRKRKSRADK